MTALILGGLIAVVAVIIVAIPFLRDNGEPELIDDGARTEDLVHLMEIRDRSLGALKELEFDHRSGQGRRRRLPRPRRAAPPSGCGGDPGARRANVT